MGTFIKFFLLIIFLQFVARVILKPLLAKILDNDKFNDSTPPRAFFFQILN